MSIYPQFSAFLDLSDSPRLLFKGGTSLSKVYDAIQRFSEDVDITVFRQDIEFSGNTDPANPALSNNQRRKLVEALVGRTADFIQSDLCLSLEESLHDCRVRLDPDDTEGMTLLVEYDSLYETGADSYVRPRIKIEGGARSALEPHSLQSVSPYIQSQLEGISPVTECQLLVADIKYYGSDLPAFARSVLAEPVQVFEAPGAHRR